MIIATAGHVDHGKTSLVHALTGVDTDRLPEEKRRGLTIDLGYAYTEIDGVGSVGFVDVPGHHRFVANMVAGVSGMDAALLVIAADDGVMPQTVEHLAILELLGIERAVVAITKIDRVMPERAEAVAVAVGELLEDRSIEAVASIQTSITDGRGIDALRAALTLLPPRLHAEGQGFRLPVDRSFVLDGVGVIATGLILSGSIGLADEIVISPAGLKVSVRGLRAQDQAVDRAVAGDRCAVHLGGRLAGRGTVGRGDWLVTPDAHLPSDRLDASLSLAAGGAPLRHETPVHVHIGAADIPGRVALLDRRQLEPGGSALARIVLDRKTSAVRGDRLILRDQSARATLAGGLVLDPIGPRRGRARPDRLAVLAALGEPDASAALAGLLEASNGLIDLEDLRRRWNLTPETAVRVWEPVAMRRAGEFAATPDRWRDWRAAALEAITTAHRASPERLGVDLREIARALTVRDDAARLVLDDLVACGAVNFSLGFYRHPDHQPRLVAEDAVIWEAVLPWLGDRERPAEVVHQIARRMDIEATSLFPVLERAGRLGLAVRVSRNRYLLPQTVLELAAKVETLGAGDNAFTVRDFRDAAGIGRNLAVEFLEFLDRRRLTHREGDHRTIIATTEAVFGRPGTCGSAPSPLASTMEGIPVR